MENNNENQEELREDELNSVAGGQRRAELVAPSDEECAPDDCSCNDDCVEPTPDEGDYDTKQDVEGLG